MSTLPLRPSIHPFHLFLSSAGYPPDLHSFPTRRSSDLVSDCPGRELEVGLRVGERDERGLELRGRQEHAALAHRVEVAGVDRKSTRLNSSHTVISYAVFCLKKKNEGKNIDTYLKTIVNL